MDDLKKKKNWMIENKIQGHLISPRIASFRSDIGYVINVDGFNIPQEIFPEEYSKIKEAYNNVLNKLRDEIA